MKEKENELTFGESLVTLLAIYVFGGGLWLVGYITGHAVGETKGIETGKKLATIPSDKK